MDSVFLITINVISAIILIGYIIHGSIKRKRIKEAAKTSQASEAITTNEKDV